MAETPSSRPYDIVLFGATGFTGGLVADYLAANLPDHARWAVAGRSRAKLDAVRDRLRGREVDILQADAADRESLRVLADSARVVITTVGPYLQHGGPLVAACASAGTDYVDLTGEPEFIDRMYLEQHTTAQESGARLVHACGFDSIPHDLGVLFTIRRLPAAGRVSVRGIVRSDAMLSGGTFHSALGQLARARQKRRAAYERKQVEPDLLQRRVRARSGSVHRDRDLGLWLLPLPTCDPVIIQRSAAANSDYGTDFSYSHYLGVKRPHTLLGIVAGMGVLMAAAQVGYLRRLLGKRLPQGQGPSAERRQRSWFSVDFIAETAGAKLHTRVRGGDPGYGETSKMLAEAAMCLAFDDNPKTSGQVTTASALGDNLLVRLMQAGITFAVIDEAEAVADRH